ncbi:MAG: hypothetical protein ABI321_07355 [Polyangia bacterium]
MFLPILVEELESVLQNAEDELRLEQAVRGLDALQELAVQALLADGLARRHRVTREAYYPSVAGKRSHRARCDLVLTPTGRELETQEEPLLRGCAPEDAFWLELKVAHQLRPSGLSHPRYGSQWRNAIVADARKLRCDPRIVHAALGLVVFTDGAATLDKDLGLFEALLGEAGVFGFRSVRSIGITDRIGHSLCSVALWPVL